MKDTVKVGNAYKILAGEPEWKKTLQRPRHSWENNIKMDLKRRV
jgi:hypothetical protein